MMWARQDFTNLLKQVPNLHLLSQRIIADNIYATQQRVYSAISSTAEEKYEEFLRTSPRIAERVPLHMVASYLGVTRETLSRVRSGLVRR